MAIFNSYVKLPEGKLPELADIPHVMVISPGFWLNPHGRPCLTQVAPERKDVRGCAEAWRARRNVFLSYSKTPVVCHENAKNAHIMYFFLSHALKRLRCDGAYQIRWPQKMALSHHGRYGRPTGRHSCLYT